MERLTAKQVANDLLGISETKVNSLRARAHDPLPCRDYGGCIRFVASEVLEWDARQSNTMKAAS